MKKITLLMLLVFTITTQAQNKLLSSISEFYNNNTWETNSGENYEYDTNNNLITETGINWDNVNNAWADINYKTTYTYNASNKVTQAIYQDSFNKPFGNSSKTTYSYTAGRLTESIDYDWEDSIWVVQYKYVVTYNANNLPSTVVFYEWDGTQWENNERTTFSYNANNKVLSSITERWVSAQWENSYKSLYIYNANNKLISDRGANWDIFNSIWVEAGAYRVDYVLDATGNRISETNSGNYNAKSEKTYDSSKLMASFAHPFRDKTGIDYFAEDFPYINKLQVDNNYYFNATTSSYELSNRTTYNYDNAITLSTATIEDATATIAIYPNPTRDLLNIQNPSKITIDKVFVTDMTGKKVIEQNNSSQINVQNLAKGMYVLEVIAGDKKEVRKFIKE